MDPYAHCADIVRRRDRDRYIAALFAPESARKHLFALYAFGADVARVGDVVADPALGEIRLQWWRDALARAGGDGHPIAAALIEGMRAFTLPLAAFEMLLDARTFDLHDDPMPSLRDLEGYAGEIASSLMHLAATVLADGRDPDSAEAAGYGGVAHTLPAVMRALPLHSARRRCYLPDDLVAAHALDRESLFAGRLTPELAALLADLRSVTRRHLAAATRAIGRLAPAVMPAFLPLALVGPYLDRMDRADYDPFTRPLELARWRRQWIIWRAARRR
ncbi:MAG: phytoene/squalene synthase family protein [Bauldia sp.]